MKKMVLSNIVLLSISILFFVLDFFILNQLTKFFFITPILILFIEAGVFLFTFRHMKKSSLRSIRKILGIYNIIGIMIIIFIKVYTSITGYDFIYYGYTPLLLPFVIYPSILWIMLRLMTLKNMINNRGIIAAITTIFTIVVMGINGISLLETSTVTIQEVPNAENIVVVRKSRLFDSWDVYYTQKNIFFMEYIDTSEN